MLGNLKYVGSKHTEEEAKDKSAALKIYQDFTQPDQRAEFVQQFFDPKVGNGGKNVKALVVLRRTITAEGETQVSCVADFLTRHIH